MRFQKVEPGKETHGILHGGASEDKYSPDVVGSFAEVIIYKSGNQENTYQT